MRMKFSIFALFALVIIALLPLNGLAGPPAAATMVFGRPDVWSSCNFPCEDAAPFHAADKIQPGSVSILAGGTVDFDIEGFHQVAIYAAGTRPKDIEPDEATFPFVNDEDRRIFIGGLEADASFTFVEPGKYLVICNITPHFEEAQMWGWVHVH